MGKGAAQKGITFPAKISRPRGGRSRGDKKKGGKKGRRNISNRKGQSLKCGEVESQKKESKGGKKRLE